MHKSDLMLHDCNVAILMIHVVAYLLLVATCLVMDRLTLCDVYLFVLAERSKRRCTRIPSPLMAVTRVKD